MKKILMTAVLLTGGLRAQAALLVSESFSSSTGALTGTSADVGGTWTENAQTGTTPYSIVSGSLTAPSGFAASSGNMACKGGVSGRESQIAFDTQTTGTTVYYSLLINVPVLKLNTATELCALTLNDGADYASVRYQNTGEDYYTLGVTYRNAISNRMDTAQLAAGSTHLVVVSYQINSGFLNDVVNFWLDPDMSTFGSETAPAPLLTLTGAQADATSLNMFELNNASAMPVGILFDEIRVGTTWADVTPIPEPATTGMLGLGALMTVMFRRRIHS